MIPMTSAGLSKSLNQRFFLVTLAQHQCPPQGRAKRVQGRIFDSDAGLFVGGLLFESAENK